MSLTSGRSDKGGSSDDVDVSGCGEGYPSFDVTAAKDLSGLGG